LARNVPAGAGTDQLQPPPSRRIGRRGGLQPRVLPYVFVSASLLIVVVLNIVPLAFTLLDSVQKNSLLDPTHPFVGLKNYVGVLTDPDFQNAFRNTMEYLVLIVVGVIGLGLPFALWLQGVKHRGLMIALLMIPWAVPGTVNGELWSLIFKPTNGLLNGILQMLHITSTDVIWLQGSTALPLTALTLIWQVVPFATLILLAGLEYIPTELLEAARVDGAGSLTTFQRITLPLLRPAIAISIVQASISALAIFDQIYVLNGNSARTISLVQQMYLYTFRNLDFGFGVSAAMITTVVSVGVSLTVLAVVYREVEY
jgi:multiple sugar transport system permease protein